MLDRRTQVRLVAVIAVIALGLGAALLLTARPRSRASAGSAKNPVVLVLSPAHADAGLAGELGAALSRASGLHVELRRMSSRAAAVAAIAMPGVDGGVLPLFDYLLARQEFGVQAALQLVRGNGQCDAASVLLVKDGTVLAGADGLAGLPVAFVDRASTTGYLLPARYLVERGVEVKPVFSGDHETSIAMLARGEVVAVGTYAHHRPGFHVLAPAGSAPNEPVFFHPRLPRATRDRIAAAFTSLASSAEGQTLLARMAEATGVAPVDDAAYTQISAALAVTEQRLEDLVPGGHRLVQQLHTPPRPLGD